MNWHRHCTIADDYFIVPREDAEGYLDIILSLCKEKKVDAVLSLIDPELSLLAENRQSFLDIGTMPIVSGYEEVEMCFDQIQDVPVFEGTRLQNGAKLL